MKKFSSKLLRTLTAFCIAICAVLSLALCLSACNKNEVVQPVVITVEGATDGQTLKSYMDGMESKGQISFVISDGMVTEINGVKQAANCYWMLYTDDSENADTSWGTCEYEGKTLGSAIYGAETLTVKNGCIYIWRYEKF